MSRKGRDKIFLFLKEEQINLLDLRSYTDTKQRSATGKNSGNTLPPKTLKIFKAGFGRHEEECQVCENYIPKAQEHRAYLKMHLDQDNRAPSSPNMNSNQ